MSNYDVLMTKDGGKLIPEAGDVYVSWLRLDAGHHYDRQLLELLKIHGKRLGLYKGLVPSGITSKERNNEEFKKIMNMYFDGMKNLWDKLKNEDNEERKRMYDELYEFEDTADAKKFIENMRGYFGSDNCLKDVFPAVVD